MARAAEMHIHYVLLAKEYYQESFVQSDLNEKLDKIINALGALDQAIQAGAPPESLRGLRLEICSGFLKIIEVMPA